MSVYVGKNVNVVIQTPSEKEEETMKLINTMQLIGEAGTYGLHRAYKQKNSSEPEPSNAGWSEFTEAEYNQIARSDDTRYSLATANSGEYAMLMLKFKSMFLEADVKKICSRFEGYGVRASDYGITIKIWNHGSAAWENAQTGTGSGDEWIDLSILTNLPNYIDNDGYIWVLVRTTYADDGSSHATLYCDCARGFVTKDRFHVDNMPISDLDLDGVANEIVHVRVYKNGVLITPSSVNDSEGLVVLSDGNFSEDDYFTCSYRYDADSYVAQELTVEPKQAVEGIDGLGSDVVQLWAATLKEIGGSIKEVFRPGNQNQLSRIEAFLSNWKYRNPCESSADLDLSGFSLVENRYLRVIGGGSAISKTVPPNANKFSLLGKFLVENVLAGSSVGLCFNYTDITHNYALVLGGIETINFKKNGEWSSHYVSKTFNKGWSIWLKVVVQGNYFTFYWDQGKGEWEELFSVTDQDNPQYKIGFSANGVYQADNLIYVSPSTSELGYGIVVSWSQGGSVVKIGLDKVVFPEGSIPSPKNAPVFITTPFKAESAKTIS